MVSFFGFAALFEVATKNGNAKGHHTCSETPSERETDPCLDKFNRNRCHRLGPISPIRFPSHSVAPD